MTAEIACTNCGTQHAPEALDFRCRRCGGLLDFKDHPPFDPALVSHDRRGIWRYEHTFGLPEGVEPITLGEGGTPLVFAETPAGEAAFKLEFTNPTGSHKDRGVALLAAWLKASGVEEAVEDSSGNAGASFAAYAARAGIRARVFIPDYASGPKRQQIESYGAEVTRILGTRSDVTRAVEEAAEAGAVYASHASLPHLLPGFATGAYEIHEQLGEPPGAVLAPVGQGSLLLGLGRGFRELVRAGLMARMPRLIGVQAMACAPIWAVYTMGAAGMQWVTEGQTAAEGVRVRYPKWGDALIRLVADTEGTILAVAEERILPARAALARAGFYVEPTSAIVWDGLAQVRAADIPIDGPIVAVLTGSGLKAS